MALLDRIGKITSTPAQTPAPDTQASSKDKASSYLERLAQSKGEVQEKIDCLLLELGRAYYERHTDDHQTELEEELTVIRAAYGEIAQYQQETDEIAARQRCPACGTKLPEGSMFCNICGTKLSDAPSSTQEQAQKLCPKCNAILNPDDIFCASCGADLRK